ncbi:LOW QUALITY PROTEIN: Hypothetical protein PHPALM_13934 [Phytophthora palmivora]|uniref:Uncharacterized protein n=1 Tax=Phytophthora palmivora TaxID=4796 RepID=A0A2P4XWB0_9STRA|nr:LOW QUALITY PROTEIN: Hypothetical protein PHPALM_13934 [Phytophthora palmivora]
MENFDMRVSLYGVDLLRETNYAALCDEESDESGSDVPNIDDKPKHKLAEKVNGESDAMNYEERKTRSGLRLKLGNTECTARTFRSSTRICQPPGHSNATNRQGRKYDFNEKPRPLCPLEQRNQEAKGDNFPGKDILEYYDCLHHIRRKVFCQERRESVLIAVATSINPPLSFMAHANVHLDTSWAIGSGCTSHVTHEAL